MTTMRGSLYLVIGSCIALGVSACSRSQARSVSPFLQIHRGPSESETPLPDPSPIPLNPWEEIEQNALAQHPEMPQKALDYAFSYLWTHSEIVTNQNYLTLIDFDLPSTQERMYVIDLKTASVSTYLVAHGKNSGENYATRFSNTVGSNMSSLGVYLTGKDYYGDHGLSMFLRGMESTNSNAEVRSIVFHAADYVSYSFIDFYGRLGRSWGCPAVNPQFREELVSKLKDGSVFYIFHSSLIVN